MLVNAHKCTLTEWQPPESGESLMKIGPNHLDLKSSNWLLKRDSEWLSEFMQRIFLFLWPAGLEWHRATGRQKNEKIAEFSSIRALPRSQSALFVAYRLPADLDRAQATWAIRQWLQCALLQYTLCLRTPWPDSVAELLPALLPGLSSGAEARSTWWRTCSESPSQTPELM